MTTEYRNFVYPPARAIAASIETYEEQQKNPRLFTYGIPELDSKINPPVPGDLIVEMGRPGMGKTISLVWRAKRDSQVLNDMKAPPKEVVLYVTWETRVEEFVGLVSSGLSGVTLADIGQGKADLKKVRKAAATLLNDRIIIIGRSRYNVNDSDFNLLDLEAVIQDLQEDDYTVRAVYIDYLQVIPPLYPSKGNWTDSAKTMYVSENLFYCKTMAVRYGFVCHVAVQAKRDVDQQDLLRMPGLDDAQWSSAIEQAADKVFGNTIPSKYMKMNVILDDVAGYNYKVLPHTLVKRMWKQRWGEVDSNCEWVLEFDPVKLTMRSQPTIGRYVPDLDDDDVM